MDYLQCKYILVRESACFRGESRTGDYAQSLSSCQRQMGSHYLTALFPPEHITRSFLCVPPPQHIACLQENRMEHGRRSGPNQDGAAGASVCISSLGHTLYKQMSLCLPPSLISDPINVAGKPAAPAAALLLLDHQALITERERHRG